MTALEMTKSMGLRLLYMPSKLLVLSDAIGKRIVGFIQFTVEILWLVYLTFKTFTLSLIEQSTLRKKGLRAVLRVVVMQIYFTGVQCLPMITVLGLVMGSIVVLQSVTQLSKFGGINTLGELLVLTIIRDLGPILTSLIVIARSGTGVAAELATMKVNREIDNLEAMGISTLDYIIVPRVVGGVLSVIGINVWFSAIGIMGGYMISALFLNVHWDFYVDKVLLSLTATDLAFFLLKNFIVGGAIFIIACTQGLSANIAAFEVPIVTIGCVVKSIFFCLSFHLASTLSFYIMTNKFFFLSGFL